MNSFDERVGVTLLSTSAVRSLLTKRLFYAYSHYGSRFAGTYWERFDKAGIECDLDQPPIKAHITALQQKGAHIVGKVDLTVGVSCAAA